MNYTLENVFKKCCFFSRKGVKYSETKVTLQKGINMSAFTIRNFSFELRLFLSSVVQICTSYNAKGIPVSLYNDVRWLIIRRIILITRVQPIKTAYLL